MTATKMIDSKLILTNYEESICRVHFLLVGEVIAALFVLMATIIAATHWYDYSLLLYSVISTVLTFYSAWTLHIRLLITATVLLFLEVAFKLVALILLSHERITIYNECYLPMKECAYSNWREGMVNLANGIAFLFPSTIVTFINMVSCLYLVYLFKNSRR